MKCPSRLALAFLLLSIELSPAARAADDLSKPTPVRIGKVQLDVEQLGQAAPFVADFDGDGRPDLLVGEGYQGRMRIYRNVGGAADPRLDGYTFFKDGDPSGCVWAGAGVGFGPQVVDFDGDGRQDVISGDRTGRLIVFPGLADGGFGAGEPVKDREGRELRIEFGLSAFACDWDGDGDLDLVLGIVEPTKCNVLLLRNTGTRAKYQFGSPEKLEAGGKEIVAPGGHAGPVAADWDGDGKLDLVLGAGDGSVSWYRNIGTRGETKLATAKELVPAHKPGGHGRYSKICVTDWNGDGRLDLVLGDRGNAFDKVLSPAEEKWREELRKRQEDLLRKWSTAFREYRRLAALEEPKTDAGRSAHQKELSAANKQMKQLHAERELLFRTEQSLKPGKQFHGRVWVCIRKADAA